MRIRMLKTRVLDKGKGATETYHGHPEFPSHYTVADDLARKWIKEGAAEDFAGKVKRLSLLSYDEAVAAGLVPAGAPPEDYDFFRETGAPRPPPPPIEQTPDVGSLWDLRKGSAAAATGFDHVGVVSATADQVLVFTPAGEEMHVERADFVARYERVR